VFSLRTTKSLGVGEFLDLKSLVDLCNKMGLKLIQLLPVNDTSVTGTWVDSYPYRCRASVYRETFVLSDLIGPLM